MTDGDSPFIKLSQTYVNLGFNSLSKGTAYAVSNYSTGNGLDCFQGYIPVGGYGN